MHKLTDAQIGYLAGLVDGEGQIGLRRTVQNDTFHYNPAIEIYNANYPLILWCHMTLSMGSVYERDRNPNRHKISYTYRVSTPNVKTFLNLIRPYLIA